MGKKRVGYFQQVNDTGCGLCVRTYGAKINVSNSARYAGTCIQGRVSEGDWLLQSVHAISKRFLRLITLPPCAVYLCVQIG